jgi:hypothetical protein
MRLHPAKAVTPALASVAIVAALVAAGRPLMTTPAPPSSPVTVARTTAYVAPPDPAVVALTDRRHPPLVIRAPDTWTVEKGDTLSGIAQSVYGTSGAWYYLQQASHLKSTVISPGQVLRLPAPRGSYPAPPVVRIAVTDTAAAQSLAPPSSTGSPQAMAEQIFGSQYSCAADIITVESGWQVTVENPSGAYGLGQALPASKMAPYGPDYLTDPLTQLTWMHAYVDDVYGGACNAWDFHLAHGYY